MVAAFGAAWLVNAREPHDSAALAGLDPVRPPSCSPGFPGEGRSAGLLTISSELFDASNIRLLALVQNATVPLDAGTSLPTGPPRLSPIVFKKDVDKHTLFLFLALTNGANLATVTVDLLQAGEVYHRMKLSNVRVVDMSTTVESRCGGGYVHLDVVTMTYETIEWIFEPAVDSFGQDNRSD